MLKYRPTTTIHFKLDLSPISNVIDLHLKKIDMHNNFVKISLKHKNLNFTVVIFSK